MSLHLTQFPGLVKSEDHTVVIGLDFGTSSSKVVINNQTANMAFAVDFGPLGHPSNSFLIPTRPYFDKEGNLCLASINEGMPLRELKGALMGNNTSEFVFNLEKEMQATVQLLTIAYLAKVIGLSRDWYLKNQNKSFGHTNIHWQLNIGVPSIGRQFKAKKSLFKSIAIGAWWLSSQQGTFTKKDAELASEHLMNPNLKLKDIHVDNINAIPEIVAEVVGYSRSDQRNQGLHLLIDVGAGTVDIASFNLGADQGSDKYSILTGDVEWLGAFELHKFRINNVKQRIIQWLDQFGTNEDPVSALPEMSSGYMPDKRKLNITRDRDIDMELFKMCTNLVQKTMIYLRKKRDPHSPQWKSGIPTFICGGGSQCLFYNDVIDEVSQYWVTSTTGGLKIVLLPKPINFQMGKLEVTQFYRLAVAYGLSVPEYDIGVIYSPDEIEDMPQLVKRNIEDNFIDKDQV